MKSSPAVSLLLTNLRLLDYDGSSEGSFPVAPEVFTSLKNKGKAFEHIIHHLFSSFDPEECAIRLEACWPIYEPAQSREFRNVVFKWLTDLKRSGQLGNILVRKTLLDDCSGERYEELLLALSTTVLRDRIENGFFKDVSQGTVAYSQTSSLTPSHRALTALILAYQASLSRLLHCRRLSKSQWASFSTFLSTKETEISTLYQSLARSPADETQKSLPRGYEGNVLRKWKNNWLGDQRWLDILLQGDPEFTRDQFFELSFEKALAKHHHFKNGISGVRSGEISLKALEKQVREQETRLGELRQLRQDTLKTVPNLDPPSAPRTTAEAETEPGLEAKVVFQRHQQLRTVYTKSVRNCLAGVRNEYTELLVSLSEDLAATGAPSRQLESQINSRYHLRVGNEPQHAETEQLQGLGEVTPKAVPAGSNYLRCDYLENTPPPTQKYSPSSNPPMKVSQQIDEYEQPRTNSTDVSDEDERFSNFEVSPPVSQPRESLPVSLGHTERTLGRFSLGFGDDELLAEQIVSSVTGATDSPEKPSPIKRNRRQDPYQLSPRDSPSSSLDESFDVDGSQVLHIAQSPTANQFHSRSSSFNLPDNRDLSTPSQSPSAPTPREDLLMSEDYNSVFKSRPKIALSPKFSPSTGTPDRLPNLSLLSEVGGTPEAGYSEGESEDDQNISSPLRLKSERRRMM